MNNQPINSSDQHKKETVDRALQSLQGKYMLVGRRRVRAWHLWLVLGIIVGVAAGVFWVVSRTM